MTIRFSIAACALLASVSCGPKALELPADPIDRAATCGVVAAAETRSASGDIKSALPFDAQTKILHHALLAGAQGDSFEPEKAGAVSQRMQELQDAITSGKWRDLAPGCRAAFPQAEIKEVTLPADRFDAQLGCDELADFLATAMASQEKDYSERMGEFSDLTRKFNATLGPGLRSRVGADLDAQRDERRKALARTAKLGSPAAVMRQCVEKFG